MKRMNMLLKILENRQILTERTIWKLEISCDKEYLDVHGQALQLNRNHTNAM